MKFNPSYVIFALLFILFLIGIMYFFIISMGKKEVNPERFPLSLTLEKGWEISNDEVIESTVISQKYYLEIVKDKYQLVFNAESFDETIGSSTGGGYIKPMFEMSEDFLFVGYIQDRPIYRDAAAYTFDDSSNLQYGYYEGLEDGTLTPFIQIFSYTGEGDHLFFGLSISAETEESLVEQILQEADSMVLSLSNSD